MTNKVDKNSFSVMHYGAPMKKYFVKISKNKANQREKWIHAFLKVISTQ